MTEVDGRTIPYHSHPEQMAPFTAQATAEGAATLFQATVHAADLLVKVHILIPATTDGISLIGVKSSSGYKANYQPLAV
ncbi:MAG: hypothetical protein KJ069_22930 [Anaerolineae bacterium]|nr:hypothetical protein [Anaerolineae bacterium]